MSRLKLAIEQIVFARNYTLGLLDQTKPDDWFRIPPGSVSHIGWQVGHIAFAEYRLALWRIRGPQAQDDALLTPEFMRLFGANSVPEANSAFPADDLRCVLTRVHEQVLRELPGLTDAELDQPVPHPHPFAKTKLLALLWCAHHEMLHAGQIGLLRRHLGYTPLW
ncbi:MAG: DinB family protein [Planctomycetes bacterium]|nr:DinB family protein [Planctomycetota bacterium]